MSFALPFQTSLQTYYFKLHYLHYFGSVYVLLVFLSILKNSEEIISPLGSNILEFCGKCCKNVIIISTSFLCYFSIVWLHDFGTL